MPVKLQSLSSQRKHLLPEQTGLATPAKERALPKQVLSNESLIRKYKTRADSVRSLDAGSSKGQGTAAGSALRNPKFPTFANRSLS